VELAGLKTDPAVLSVHKQATSQDSRTNAVAKKRVDKPAADPRPEAMGKGTSDFVRCWAKVASVGVRIQAFPLDLMDETKRSQVFADQSIGFKLMLCDGPYGVNLHSWDQTTYSLEQVRPCVIVCVCL
jgi:hypothetical protein